ncbi:MAG: PD40 domain-containing protein [Candidatus Eremiobacteraeota bacterium]|nr:PD40 domain-containing protein [Candidatus Eremiobacteraeota bacterium]
MRQASSNDAHYRLAWRRIDTNQQIYRRQESDGSEQLVSCDANGQPGDGNSYAPVLSADGRFVAFESDAANLVEGDDNQARDVFLKDLQTGTVERLGPGGSARLSGDGQSVLFSSGQATMVWQAGKLTKLAEHQDKVRTFPGDLSSDGKLALLCSEGILDGEIRLRYPDGSAQTIAPETGDRQAYGATFSADDRYVAYSSRGGPRNEHVKVFDRLRQTHEIVSRSSLGEPANGACHLCEFSPSGRYLTFGAYADNLDPADTNTNLDFYFHDRLTGQTRWMAEHHLDQGEAWPTDSNYLELEPVSRVLDGLPPVARQLCRARLAGWGEFDWSAARDFIEHGASLANPARLEAFRRLELIPSELFPALSVVGAHPEWAERFSALRARCDDFRSARVAFELWRGCEDDELLQHPPRLGPQALEAAEGAMDRLPELYARFGQAVFPQLAQPDFEQRLQLWAAQAPRPSVQLHEQDGYLVIGDVELGTRQS